MGLYELVKYKGKKMSRSRYNQLKKAKENRLNKIPKIGVSKQLYDLIVSDSK